MATLNPKSYTTLADFKLFAGITSNSDDELLAALIDAASRRVESHCDRKFYWQENAIHTFAGLDHAIESLPMRPVHRILEVRNLVSGTAAAATGYHLDGDAVFTDNGFYFDGYRNNNAAMDKNYALARENWRVKYVGGYVFAYDTAKSWITCPAVADLSDGDTVTLFDGAQEVTFEFDVAGDGVAASNTQVDVSGDTTASEVAATLRTALNASALGVTTSDEGSGLLELVHDSTGEPILAGNGVGAPGFVVTSAPLGPADLVLAVRKLVNHVYKNKNRNPAIRRQHVLEAAVWYSDEGGIQSEVKALLEPYRRIVGV